MAPLPCMLAVFHTSLPHLRHAQASQLLLLKLVEVQLVDLLGAQLVQCLIYQGRSSVPERERGGLVKDQAGGAQLVQCLIHQGGGSVPEQGGEGGWLRSRQGALSWCSA